MSYNKHRDQFLELDTERRVLYQKLGELEVIQEWYKKFDLGSTATTVGASKRLIADSMSEIRQLEPRISKQAADISRLKERASPGWNPKYWFSDERASIKVNLGNKISELKQLENRLDWLKTEAKSQSDKVARLEGELKKYNKHDSLECEAKISALNQEMTALTARLQGISQKADELDALLSPLLAELKKLISQRSNLASDASVAQSMVDSLSRAANGFERKKIHERCEQIFENQSPSKVKVFKEKQLEGIDRNIKNYRHVWKIRQKNHHGFTDVWSLMATICAMCRVRGNFWV